MDEREKLITEVVEKLNDNKVKFVLITTNEKEMTHSTNASMGELLECFDELINLMMKSCKEVHIPKLEVVNKLQNRFLPALVKAVNEECVDKQEEEDAD